MMGRKLLISEGRIVCVDLLSYGYMDGLVPCIHFIQPGPACRPEWG